MKKGITLAIAGLVGLVTQVEARSIDHEVWNPARKDMCAESVNLDVQRCLKALLCEQGEDKVHMTYQVASEPSRFAEDWNEYFTTCSADCVPAHTHFHMHDHHHDHGLHAHDHHAHAHDGPAHS